MYFSFWSIVASKGLLVVFSWLVAYSTSCYE